MNISELLQIVKRHQIDSVHPGYGFLSESADFAEQMADAGVLVVGPGSKTLEKTGDKLRARVLAEQCHVPVLPALLEPTSKVDSVEQFALSNGLPIMVKAVDGGGGRGIRLIRNMDELQSLVTRAIEESPSRQVFAEKAAVDGFRHVEVQIVGDGQGKVLHLWERECSIQRRYQKIVELAPSTISDRSTIAPVIEAAVRMAQKISYASLGTFEFLLNPTTAEFFFLEINPRLQVEHTITESICVTDIVKAQLRLIQGASFEQAGLAHLSQNPKEPPHLHSVQLRITAEDPEKHYSLSIGKVQSFRFPSGNGVRVDTALLNNVPAVVSSDFDSVLAKLILTAPTWQDVVLKARRALEDTSITGIKTNLSLLRAIVAHPDFENGACDTQWLESNHQKLLARSRDFSRPHDPLHGLVPAQTSASTASALAGSSMLFRKDDAWSLSLKPSPSASATERSQAQTHHLQLSRVLRNDFPTSLSAEITFTTPGAPPQAYTINLESTSTSASATSSAHRQGSRADSNHVIVPFSGKLVEVLVDVGDVVRKDDVVCVIKQMKMELEVRSHKTGVCTWVTEAEDDEDVAEGMLAAVIEDEGKVGAKL
nr:pyruvate carboxylase [Quercus suber]